MPRYKSYSRGYKYCSTCRRFIKGDYVFCPLKYEVKLPDGRVVTKVCRTRLRFGSLGQ